MAQRLASEFTQITGTLWSKKIIRAVTKQELSVFVFADSYGDGNSSHEMMIVRIDQFEIR